MNKECSNVFKRVNEILRRKKWNSFIPGREKGNRISKGMKNKMVKSQKKREDFLKKKQKNNQLIYD